MIMSIETERKKFLAGAMCFIGFLLGVETGGLQFVLLKAAEEFGLSQVSMGSIVTVQFVAVTIAPAAAGLLSDSVGKKKVITAAAGLFAASSGIAFFFGKFLFLQIGVCGIGIAFGALEATITGALSDAYKEKSGKYISIMQGSLSLGAVLSPIAVAFAMKEWNADWRLLFLICLILSLTAILLVAAAKFESSAKKQNTLNHGGTSMGDRALPLMLLLAFGYLFMENGTTCFIDSYFERVFNASGYSAAALSAFWAATAVSRFVLSAFYHRRYAIVPAACMFAAALLAALKFTGGPAAALVIMGAIGFVYGPLSPFFMNMAVTRYPHKSGTVSGLMLAATGLGGALSPVLIGFISDNAGLRNAYFAVAFAALVEFFLFVLFCKYEKRIA